METENTTLKGGCEMDYLYDDDWNDYSDEDEGKETAPSWSEEYLNTLGMSMSDFC